MDLTVFNLLMSLLWSDVCVLLFCLLRRRHAFLRDYGFGPLFCLLAVALVRFFVPLELPFTVVIRSYRIIPDIQLALREPGPLGLSWSGWLTAIWAAVSLALLLRLFLGILRQKWRIAAMPRRNAAQAIQAVHAILPPDIRWKPTVIVSPAVPVPSVTGFFSPTFLLPELTLSQRHLQEVLRHELGHFLGRDAWIKLGIALFQAVFWWNPLVYLLGKDLNFLLEVRADAYAAGTRTEAEQLDYLEAVTEVIRQLGASQKRLPNYALSLHGSGSRDHLYTRMQLVFSNSSRRPRGKAKLVICLAALILMSYSFVVQPFGYPPKADNYIEITTDNAYLQLTKEGTYELYVDGELFQILGENDIASFPFNLLEVVKEN